MVKNAKLSLETGMLAFARSVQITEGLFFGTSSDDETVKTPVAVLEKGVRGQSSEDKAKNPGLSNPQSVEYAIVPQNHDGITLSFTARFMPLSLQPHACNNLDVGSSYMRLAEAYAAAGGYGVLAELYFWNIANARFAWRNRFQSDSMNVRVEGENGEVLVFDPLKLSLGEFGGRGDLVAALCKGIEEQLADVILGIQGGLSGEGKTSYKIRVSWNAEMEPGQEIFPSQEYVRDEKADKQLSRVLAKIPTFFGGRQVLQASMHSQKIGAALRHIDIWHGSDIHTAPIAVNPYGGVQESSAVLRDPKSKKSFYDLRKNADSLIASVENARNPDDITGEVHFVMSNLIRGGVFGSNSKKAEANG